MSFSEYIIKHSFYLSVRLIRLFSDTKKSEETARELESMPDECLGKAIADCLRKNNLHLVPYYESHDLKHVLLDYQMTPVDEIRLQAFMLGNGNWSVPSIAIFLYGAILLPGKWKLFLQDYNTGKRAIPISSWTIDTYAHRQVPELRDHVLYSKSINPSEMTYPTARTLSFATIIVGIFGMLFCLPHLWSSNMADLVGAGLPFIAGAILVAGGLMSVALLSREGGAEIAR